MSIKQDRTGTRTAEDLRRRLNVKGIDEAVQKVDINEQTVNNLVTSVTNLNTTLNSTRDTYVSTNNQTFTNTQKQRARTNIGAGTSSFSGSYSDLSNQPTSLNNINSSEYNKLNGIETGAEVNLIESISVNGTVQEIINKNVNINIGGLGIQSYSNSDSNGYIWFNNGFLIQWGRLSITPSAVNVDTTARVTYTYEYTNTPDLKVSPVIATPSLVSVSCGGGSTTAQTRQGMNIYINSTITRAVNVNWLAVGHKSI